jgi:hypothetical protein
MPEISTRRMTMSKKQIQNPYEQYDKGVKMLKKAKGGKVKVNTKRIRQAISDAKDHIFGESDEPNWEAAHATLDDVPNSEKAKKKLSEYRKYLNGKDFDEDTNLKHIDELEKHLDDLTPGERIPNPNE